MAVIYLDHPKHGSKVACAETEAAADEKNGWVRRQVAALLQSAPETINQVLPRNALSVDAEMESLRQQWQAKHGAKPHHKKSAATLRAELA